MTQENEFQNIDTSQFTLYLTIEPGYVDEFNMIYDRKEGDVRGPSIQKVISDKINIDGLTIARIDLNYDRTAIMQLLEKRGTALKTQDQNGIAAIEA